MSPGNDVLISREMMDMMLYRLIALAMNDYQGLLSSYVARNELQIRGPNILTHISSSVEYRLL